MNGLYCPLLVNFTKTQNILTSVLFLCTLLGNIRTHGQIQSNTNILLIYIDDLNFDQIGYFNKEVLTPNIDAFIKTSIEFKNAYVTSSVCTPSRFSLMTGIYASRSSSLRAKYPVDELPNVQWNTFLQKHKNIAGYLKDELYTGIVGKWHLGANSPNTYDDYSDISDPRVKEKLLEDYLFLKRDLGNKGFEFVDAFYRANPSEHKLAELRFHNVEWMTSKAIEFIDSAVNSNQQFFLYYSTTVPHSPPPLESMRKHEYVTQIGILDSTEILPSGMLAREDIIDLVNRNSKVRPYMTWLDQGVGALLDKLRDEDLYDNTMIIMMSDNQNRGKLTNYEGAHVPLMVKPVRWGNQHLVRDELVANIDIVPTILSVMKINESENNFDGLDLSPLFSENSYTWHRDHLLLEIGYSKAIVNNKGYKLIANKFPKYLLDSANIRDSKLTYDGTLFPETNVKYNSNTIFPGYFEEMQLYDLRSDPMEQNNLIGYQDYSLLAHNFYNQLKTELYRLPHKYSEYFKTDYPLKGRVNYYKPSLEVFKVVDSLSLNSADTLFFVKPDFICDTLRFTFVVLDSTVSQMKLDILSYPEWFEIADIEIHEYVGIVSFLKKKHNSFPEGSSINISFGGGLNQTYRINLYLLSQDSRPLIYPNPTTGDLLIDLDAEFQVQLFSVDGRLIPIKRERNALDIKELENGIYIIQISDFSNQLLFSEKIVKQ